MIEEPPPRSLQKGSRHQLMRRHLLEGWGGLFLFVCLGLTLETLLAYKVPLYVDVESSTRRLMWRLAHAHGTLLAMLHLGLAWTLSRFRLAAFPQPAGVISGCFTGASLLVPGGFFLAGLGAQDGDPGVSVALVPAGAVLLLVAAGLAFVESRRVSHREPPQSPP